MDREGQGDAQKKKKSSSSLSQECEENQSNCALSEGIFQTAFSREALCPYNTGKN